MTDNSGITRRPLHDFQRPARYITAKPMLVRPMTYGAVRPRSLRSVRPDVLVLLLVLAIGSRSYSKPQVGHPSARLVDTVWKIVDEKYIDSKYNGHSPTELRNRFLDLTYSSDAEDRNAAHAMLELLGDPLTRLLDPAEFASVAKEFNGETGNIGLADPWTLRDETTGALKVLHVISGSPAFRMRVQPDDLIEAIDDAPTKTMSRDEAFKRMAGKSGTVVQLSLRRGAKRLRVSVSREIADGAHRIGDDGHRVGHAVRLLGPVSVRQGFGAGSAQRVG
jgi:C-terminal processing protease CtpA/Prc